MSKQYTRPGKPIAQRFVTWAFVCLLAITAPAGAQAAAFLYTVDPTIGTQGGVDQIDKATGIQVSSKLLTIPGFGPSHKMQDINGAAINPTTGQVYAYIDLRFDDGGDPRIRFDIRQFVRFDPRSGQVTVLQEDVGVAFLPLVRALAFDPNGILYAIETSGVLSTVDLTSGLLTAVPGITLGIGTGGSESIAFNLNDGRLYHASGSGTTKIFEKIDLDVSTVTNVPLTGATAQDAATLALAYDFTQDAFLGFRDDGATGQYFKVTPGGVESSVSTMPQSTRAMFVLDTDLLLHLVEPGPRESHVYAVDRDGPYLSQLDSSTGEEIDLIGITLSAPDPVTLSFNLAGGSGLAMDPLTGELYATLVVLGERSNHRLVKLDPLTGVATLIGLTGNIISGLTFDSAGTLYAVTSDDNATFPSWLISLNITNALPSVMFALLTDNNPADGEIIAFNSNNGLLYHSSGGIAPLMETIDVSASTPESTRTNVSLGGNFLVQATALAYDPLKDQFMGAIADGRVFSMTPGGFVSYLTPARLIPLKGFGVVAPCISSAYVIPPNQWTRFALPCDSAPNNTVEKIFSALSGADYNVTWVVYKRDALTPAYVRLALTDEMTEGTGYWVYSGQDPGSAIHVIGSPQSFVDIDLVGIPEGRQNYVGHNQNVSVAWNQVVVVDGITELSIDQYDPLIDSTYACDMTPVDVSCVMSRKMNKWNGSAYQPSDGSATSPGTLDPFDGFWAQAFKPGIQLRIPVPPGGAAVAAANVKSVSFVESASLSVESSLSPDVQADNKPYKPKNSKKPKKPKKPTNEPWYIRLIASSGIWEDPGNVLGQLDTATDGNDPRDLEEPAPFGNQYLSILFTNPLFEQVNWGFTTDFRAMTKHPQGIWPFVVKAHAGISEVTISWQGEDHLFKDAWLIDEHNGEMIKAITGGSYTFEIEGGEHHFRFEVGDD